jgi:hypothetical protein
MRTCRGETLPNSLLLREWLQHTRTPPPTHPHPAQGSPDSYHTNLDAVAFLEPLLQPLGVEAPGPLPNQAGLTAQQWLHQGNNGGALGRRAAAGSRGLPARGTGCLAAFGKGAQPGVQRLPGNLQPAIDGDSPCASCSKACARRVSETSWLARVICSRAAV